MDTLPEIKYIFLKQAFENLAAKSTFFYKTSPIQYSLLPMKPSHIPEILVMLLCSVASEDFNGCDS